MDNNNEVKVRNILNNLSQEGKEKITKLTNLFEDESSRVKLKDSPREVLKSVGLELPTDKPIVVLENDEVVPQDDKAYYIQLPVICDEAEELSESSYEDVAGGAPQWLEDGWKKVTDAFGPALKAGGEAFAKAFGDTFKEEMNK